MFESTYVRTRQIRTQNVKKIRERVKGEKQVWVHTETLIFNNICSGETSECRI